jgi:Sec-independent protein translocase protein TatA
MNSFFGVGLAELVFILLLAGLLLGPQQIRRVARQLGMFAAGAQRMIGQLRSQFNQELDAAELQEMREAVADVQTLQKQLAEMRQEMRGFLTQNSAALSQIAQEPLLKPPDEPTPPPPPAVAPPPPAVAPPPSDPRSVTDASEK